MSLFSLRILKYFSISLLFANALYGEQLLTNAVVMPSPPKWLEANQVEKVTARIQSELEWTTRRIKVHWHREPDEFEKVHGLGSSVNAVTVKKKGQQAIHLGPKTNEENFNEIFGHELVHVIIFQKYKKSIPDWLEEGLANHIAKKKSVNYQWLSQQNLPKDVRKMTHSFRGSYKSLLTTYKASQALVEMLEEECDLENLIRLSVGRKMETYIQTYCEIEDINKNFRSWVKKKAQQEKDKKETT